MDRSLIGMRSVRSRPALWVSLAALVMVAVDLGAGVLSTNDAARFAVLGQDVLARGAWFFPELNGVVYSNKPLLLVWLIALVSWPLGHVTQFTAVLPSAAAGIATALAVYALGRSMFGTDAGRFAALVAVTTQGLFLHARLPMPDMLMTCFIAASLAMLWPMTRGHSGPCWLGFYACVSAAFWAKGPAGFLPLLVALGYAVANRRPGRWRDLHLPAGLLLAVLLTAPWWVRGLLSDRAVAHQVILTDYVFWYLPQHVTVISLVTPIQHVFGILFPWLLVLPAVLYRAVRFLRGSGVQREAVLFLLLSAAILLLSVALSHQQRIRYYLPLVPAFSLLIGWWAAGATVKHRPVHPIPWPVYGIASGALVADTAIFIAVRAGWRADLRASLPSSALEVVVIGGALATMIAALVHGMRRNRVARAFGVAWMASAVLLTSSYHWNLQRLNADYDYARLHTLMERALPNVSLVAVWGIQELPFTFYFRRPVASVETDDNFRNRLAGDPRNAAILSDAALERLSNRAELAVLLHDRVGLRPISVVTYSPGR